MKILNVSISYKRCRYEYTCFINNNGKTAVQYTYNLAGKYFMVFESFSKLFVTLLLSKSLVGKKNHVILIAYLGNNCFHLITDMSNGSKIEIVIIGILRSGNNTI